MELKTIGKVVVERHKVYVQLSLDLARYYTWLINKAHYNTIPLWLPRHGAHLSIILPTVHKLPETTDLRKTLSECQGKKVEVEYSIDIRRGGKSKGFTNFWVPARCNEARFIKIKAGVKDAPDYRGEHITFCSNKHLKNR